MLTINLNFMSFEELKKLAKLYNLITKYQRKINQLPKNYSAIEFKKKIYLKGVNKLLQIGNINN
jgi:dihydroorotase